MVTTAGVDRGESTAVAASSLARLPGPTLARVLAGARPLRVPARTVTHGEGDADPYVELVITGLVRVFVAGPDGRSLTVRYCRPGALVGVMSLFATDFVMPAYTQALVDVDLLRLSPEQLRRTAAEDVDVADVLLRELADRAHRFLHEVADGVFTSVRQRVARHLLDLAAEESAPVGPLPEGPALRDPGPAAGGQQLVVRASQSDVADAVGSVREVVVRALAELRLAGMVATHRDRIVLLDPVRLSREQAGT